MYFKYTSTSAATRHASTDSDDPSIARLTHMPISCLCHMVHREHDLNDDEEDESGGNGGGGDDDDNDENNDTAIHDE